MTSAAGTTETRPPLRRSIALVVAAIVALTACGGDGDSDAAGDPEGSAETTTTTTAASQSTETPDTADLGGYECPTSTEVAEIAAVPEADVPLEASEGADDNGQDQGVTTVCRYKVRVMGVVSRWTSPAGASVKFQTSHQGAPEIDASGLGDMARLYLEAGTARLYVVRGSDFIQVTYSTNDPSAADADVEATARALWDLVASRVEG